MSVDINKRALTTGDIAKLCGVNFRTVIRWIQRGHLRAFQLPGRGDNRVLMADFLKFLRENKMPIPEELKVTSRRVLIVEDEEKMANTIQRTLKRRGFETQIAVDGISAGTLETTFEPAVMTHDLNMPGLGGLEVLKNVRANSDLAQVKVLVVSAMPDEDLKQALDAGADDVMKKPFKNEALADKVAELAGLETE
jgi:excisionase family DNA binding protein